MECRLCGRDAGAGSMGGRDVCGPCDTGYTTSVEHVRTQIAMVQSLREKVTELETDVSRLSGIVAGVPCKKKHFQPREFDGPIITDCKEQGLPVDERCPRCQERAKTQGGDDGGQ